MKNETLAKIKLEFLPCEENKYYPKFLKSEFLFYYAFLLLILKIIIVPFFIYFPNNIFFADLTKTTLFELTNSTREALGLPPLKENPTLNTAAFLKAKDMLEKDYFAHQSPEGFSPWYWLKRAGYNYQFAGENLAIGFLDSEEVYQAWMKSPVHKTNLLNPNYQEIGIAVVRGDFQGNEINLIVQFFGTLQAKTQLLAEKEEIPPLPKKEEVVQKEEKTVQKEEIVPAQKEEIVPQEVDIEEVLSKEEKPAPVLSFFYSFLTSDYYNVLQKIIYGSLIFVIISLFITVLFDVFIYRVFSIQYKDIIFKMVCFCLLLGVSLFIDKMRILQFIPHDFNIY